MKTIITITFLILRIVSYGQQLPDEVAIHNIMSKNIYFDSKAINSAKIAFKNFLSDYPASNYRPFATYYLAEIENRFNRIDSAEIFYKQVLIMCAPDSINPGVKHNSAKRLAEIYIEKRDYNIAKKYLDEARDKFVDRYDCGNARARDFLNMQCLYSICYIGQKNYQKAIDTLAPLMFANGFADNSTLVKLLYETYLKIYTKKEIQEQFLNAAKTLVIKKEKDHSYSFLQPVIKVFNKEIEVSVYDYVNKLTQSQQKQKCIDKITNSEIYRLAVAD